MKMVLIAADFKGNIGIIDLEGTDLTRTDLSEVY